MNNLKQQMSPESSDIRSDQKFLIVGLGNPGRHYQRNRHNLGFMTIDHLAEEYSIPMRRVQNKAIVGDGHIADRRVILAKPQTFMNLSGESIGPLANFYRIWSANILVVYDELDLPLGTVRLREKGGAGGHNGMKSLIQHLGSDFPRLRLGIGRPPGQMPPSAFILQDFAEQELETVQELVEAAVAAIVTFLRSGIDLAMSRHNMSRHNMSRQDDLPME